MLNLSPAVWVLITRSSPTLVVKEEEPESSYQSSKALYSALPGVDCDSRLYLCERVEACGDSSLRLADADLEGGANRCSVDEDSGIGEVQS